MSTQRLSSRRASGGESVASSGTRKGKSSGPPRSKDVSQIPGKQRFFWARLKMMKPKQRVKYTQKVLRNPKTSDVDKAHLRSVMRENNQWFRSKG